MPPRGARATGSQQALLSLARLIARAALREVLESEANAGRVTVAVSAHGAADHAPQAPSDGPNSATAADEAGARGGRSRRRERTETVTKTATSEASVPGGGKSR
jgi:hypothetical protein